MWSSMHDVDGRPDRLSAATIFFCPHWPKWKSKSLQSPDVNFHAWCWRATRPALTVTIAALMYFPLELSRDICPYCRKRQFKSNQPPVVFFHAWRWWVTRSTLARYACFFCYNIFSSRSVTWYLFYFAKETIQNHSILGCDLLCTMLIGDPTGLAFSLRFEAFSYWTVTWYLSYLSLYTI